MSEPAVRAELEIHFRDSVTAGLKTTESAAEKTAKKVAETAAEAAKKSAGETETATNRQRSSYEKLYRAREVLGIRSESTIRREIQHTESAYKRLETSGQLSSEALARASDKARERITRLTNEMGKLTDEQKRAEKSANDLERVNSRIRGGVTVTAGTAAAAYTLKAPAMAAMSFDERLANMANTAYAERDTSGRKIGMQQLEASINKSVGRGGGGTRDQAAETLDTMIASGAMSAKDAMTMLPQIMKASSASGADPAQLAQIGIRAMQTFKIKPEDMPNVLNMALTAGQEGGFELKDMAKWLPQQMAAATMSGLSGREGFAKLAALNQASAITAGTKDEAGNNVVNLLAKINSSDTANDAKKLGINLPKYLQEQRAKGVDSVDAFGALVDKTVANREDYKALKKQLAGAKNNEDKRASLEAMTTIAQGAGIGKIIQDRQALMALLGMMNNREYMQGVLTKVRANDVREGGSIDRNYDLVSDTSAFKMRMASQEKDIGQKSVMDNFTPAIGKTADMFADLASKHPLLVGSVTLATGALTAFAGAAGLASLTMGGGKNSAIAATALKYAPKAANVGRAGLYGVGALAGDYALDKAFGEGSAISRYGSSAINFAAGGAMLGSVVPGLGTGVGAAVGAGTGLLWESLKDVYAALKPTEQKSVDVNASMTVGLAPGLVLQTQSMKTSGGGNVQMNTGRMGDVP